jgi:hypothetical protein
MAERGSTIAQTTGVISRYQQLTEIWGMDPDEAERNLAELRQDFILDMQFARLLRRSRRPRRPPRAAPPRLPVVAVAVRTASRIRPLRPPASRTGSASSRPRTPPPGRRR